MAILPSPPPVEVTWRRSARARRFSLRISRVDGTVTLSLPTRAREAEALAFLRGHEGWIRAALADMPQVAAVGIGALVPVEGQMLRVVGGTGRGVRVDGTSLVVPGDPATAGRRVAAWLRAVARERLAQACDRHAAVLGRRFQRITLRDTRSRWGSCTACGSLMFSWRLILAPPAVLDYVAAHEVAHLAEMNHSPAFWAGVARLCPGYKPLRVWLRAHGADLHAYRFGD